MALESMYGVTLRCPLCPSSLLLPHRTKNLECVMVRPRLNLLQVLWEHRNLDRRTMMTTAMLPVIAQVRRPLETDASPGHLIRVMYLVIVQARRLPEAEDVSDLPRETT